MLVATLGAQFAVPPGWVAHPADPREPDSTYAGVCLGPADVATPGSPNDCAIWVRSIPARTPYPTDVDLPGGVPGNPAFCSPGHLALQQLVAYADVIFGGRSADYRYWRFGCTDGKATLVAQYVVNRGPGYIVISQHADTRARAVLTAMAARSVLPASTEPLRYSDRGYVTGRVRQPGAWAVTIDRVVDALGTVINHNPATYHYLVPDAALVDPSYGPQPASHVLAIGNLIAVQTNGQHVTRLSG